MARTTIQMSSATDDITRIEYQGVLGSGAPIDSVLSYRITIETLGDDMKPLEASLETRFVRDVDLHIGSYMALTALLQGKDEPMFRIIVNQVWKRTDEVTSALWSFITDGITLTLLAILGAKPKQASSGGSKPQGELTFTGHVRAYAIANKWTSPKTGKPIGSHGVMTQETINRFVSETGINVESFNEGKRAELPATESTATQTESTQES